MKQGATALLAVWIWLALVCGAAAQSLIRDAEIERTLDRITTPILRAAGLSPNRVQFYIVNSRELNAFVAGGNNIFLHTGLLQRLPTMAQVQAVVAHEAGHIAGGHLARRNDRLRGARGTAGIGLLLAVVAAGVAGPEAALPLIAGAPEAARRGLLAHSRSEEASADQASLRYLVSAGVDPRAMLEVMRLFRGQEILTVERADPYVRTHPLWSQRVRLLEDRVASAPKGKPASAADVYWHARMVGKLRAFLESPSRTLRRVGRDTGEVATLERAIAYHRLPDVDRAMANIDALIRARPNDPFYHELRGQFLLEGGKAREATASYQRAVSLAPDEPLILAGHGRALLAQNTAASVAQALPILEKARGLDDANPGVLRDLARAYAAAGRGADASLATAERLALSGRFRDATIHAERAAKALPEGSPRWRRAQDILRIAKQVQN